jgi:diguanylate cyclase (GGDEF)-like protein
MKLRSKFSLVFGIVTTIATIVTAYTVYNYLYSRLQEATETRLKSVAMLTAMQLQANRSFTNDVTSSFASPLDYLRKDYQALRRELSIIQRANGLSWLAVYRRDGDFFESVVDGSEEGDSFCPGYPILDVSENMLRACSGEVDLVETYSDAYGIYLTANYPLTNEKGEVVAILDASLTASKLVEAQKEVFKKTALITLLVLVFTILVCMLLSDRLARPVRLLATGAREFASGNLDHRITVRSKDEIGYLTLTFNEMATSLKLSRDALNNRIKELSALNEISSELNFAPNVETVIDAILRKAMDTMCANGVGMVLVDSNGDPFLKHAIHASIDRVEAARQLINPESTISRKVLAEGVVFLSNDVQKEEGIPNFEVSALRSVLVVPLKVEDRVMGLLAACDKKDEGLFSEVDSGFMGTLASHLALSIEKIRLYELAITDGLTKLYVHRYFQAALERELVRVGRYGGVVSLILFDIDHFKKFNDTYGHQQGDTVLSIVAKLLSDTIRQGLDIAARYGGEEFAVILPETSNESAFLAAERIRKRIESHDFPGQEKPLKVTISLGISTWPDDATTRAELIKCADLALYGSKEAGRNVSTLYSKMPKEKS